MKHCNHSMKWNFYNQRVICNTLYSTAHVIRQEENERFCDTCNAQGLLHDAKTTLIVFSNHLSVILKMVIIKDDGTHTTSFPCPGEVVTVLVRSTILIRLLSSASQNTFVSLLFLCSSFRYVLHHFVLPHIGPFNRFIDNW